MFMGVAVLDETVMKAYFLTERTVQIFRLIES